DAFVTKINSTGTALVYSTYLGGSADDRGQGIVVDAANNAYITGMTSSFNFPAVGSNQNYVIGFDAFVTRLNPSGSAPMYSTFLGGNGDDRGEGIALDTNAN